MKSLKKYMNNSRMDKIVNEAVAQSIDSVINEGIDFDPHTKTVSYNPSHEENVDTSIEYNPTIDGDDLSGVFVFEVFGPGLEDLGRQLPSLVFLEALRCGLHFVSQSEDVDDVLVRIIADRTQKGRYRQLLLTVDVGIHDIVDIGRKFDPGSFEGDDPG